MQHAEFPSCLRFSFTRNKLEKSRKPSSSACACLCHDRNRNRGNPLSKLGGSSFASFFVYCAIKKLMHQRTNPIHFFFQREMASIEKMELCAGKLSFIEFSTLHRKDSIVFAPS